jgi:exosortase
MSTLEDRLPAQADRKRIFRVAWEPLLVALAVLLCYAPIWSGLLGQWAYDEDMSHGFVVPLAIAWIVWRERRRWLKLTPQPSAWGFVLIALGLLGHIASAGGAGLFAGVLSVIVTVTGAVLAIGGFAYLRVWLFPLALTVFMLPKLAVVYNQVTLPLQLAATNVAATILRVFGGHVQVDGNIIRIASQQISVEEACSGLRYLLPLGFLSVMLGYLYGKKAWMRWGLLLAAIPVAIGANALRVASTAWLMLINPAYGEGLYHALTGIVIFAACLAVMLGINWIFNRLHGGVHEA